LIIGPDFARAGARRQPLATLRGVTAGVIDNSVGQR
jgi:hypothetical protein